MIYKYKKNDPYCLENKKLKNDEDNKCARKETKAKQKGRKKSQKRKKKKRIINK